MNRNRSVAAAALVSALAATVLVSALSSPTVANPAFALSGPAPVQARPDRGHAWIEGVIEDKATGRALDDAQAEAYPAEDPGGDPVASSLTYESPDGRIDHGFYRLWGLAPGEYLLRFTSRVGHYEEATALVRVGNRDIKTLDVELRPSTTTSARLKADRVTTAEKPRVTVRVTTDATRRPIGDVEVRIGRRIVGADTLAASDRGSVTIALKKQPVGTYQVRAFYTDSKKQRLAASSSDAVTLRVVRVRKHHHTGR